MPFFHFNSCPLCRQKASKNQLCHQCKQRLFRIGPHCKTCAKSVTDTSLPCGDCLNNPPSFEALYIGFRYRAAVRDVLLQAKYGKSKAAIYLLQQWVEEIAVVLPTDIDLVVPMPMALTRLFQRGFNQTHYLASTASAALNIPCIKAALKKHTRSPQSKQKTDAERLYNIRGAFSIGQQSVYGHVLLVDDVLTSGATVQEAARTLKIGGAKKVSVLVIAAR